MPISADKFKDALRYFPSGVTIVAVRAGEVTHGLTVSAFTSVSPEPPLVAVMVDHRHRAHELLEQEGAVFSVNVLGEEQRELSDRFAWEKTEDRFLAGNWTAATTGAPVLADALAWLDCTIHSRATAGSHTIYIGEVRESSAPGGRPPLVYWNRAYQRLERS